MGMLERNEDALKLYNNYFFSVYKKEKEAGINHCTIEEAVNHENIICYLKDKHGWRLNSIYEPGRAAALYASRYAQLQDEAVICIYGLSDGKSLRGILANCNETQEIIVYEPSINIFLAAMEMFPLEDILQRKKMHLIVGGINEDHLSELLEQVITYRNRERLVQCILPNYDLLFPEMARDYIEKILYVSKMKKYLHDTEMEQGTIFGDNMMHNMPYILRESSVQNLCQHFGKADLGDVPAIIVSAGPSLDKNIKDLKQAEGKAFIIGVDSALKALVREDIHVNLAVTVDPKKNPDVFADDRLNDMPYLMSVYALPQVVAGNRKRMFFENASGFETYSAVIEACTGKNLAQVEAGGSVATVAFSLACVMGFRQIVLVGQDLAFTGGKGHVSGFERSEDIDRAHVAERGRIEVEALGGGTILTDMQMEAYLQWFEMHIAQVKELVTVYNATEGGARIRGAVEVALKDVIADLCKTEVDFDKMLKEVPNTFTDEERERLREELLASDDYLQHLQAEWKKGIRAYEDLIKLEHKPDSGQYQKALYTIGQINKLSETECYMRLIKLYAKDAIAEDAHIGENPSVRDIANQGIALLEGYIKGTLSCRESVEKILLPGLQREE